MCNVAFLMIDIPDLSGAGGAERFFYDFFIRNNNESNKENLIYFYTNSDKNIKAVSYGSGGEKYIHILRLYRNRFFKKITEKVKIVRTVSNIIRELFTFIPLYISFIKNNITVLHIPLYESKDYYLIWFFDKLTFYKRPKISISIVDCRIPYYYELTNKEYYYSNKVNFGRLFKTINIDGILSWYKLFRDFAESKNLIRNTKLIYCIKSRYSIVDTEDCWENKQEWIVWAGRLDTQKDPMFFLEAVNQVIKSNESANYKFKLFGKGQLSEKIKNFIQEHDLAEKVELSYHNKMKEIFVQSKCYVSTQMFENFPSMSMAEAMACQNAIIAKNVGQTDYFVKQNQNGFLVNEDSYENLANQIINYIKLDERDKMRLGKMSSNLLNEVHNFKNFQMQFNDYITAIKH